MIATGARVLNIRDLGRIGTWPPDVRRIDRRSPYGNPFRLEGDWILWTALALGYRADAAGRRSAAIALYRGWMTGKPGQPFAVAALPDNPSGGEFEYTDGSVRSIDAHVRGLALMGASFATPPVFPPHPDLSPLVGMRLACWCWPLECHGDVLVELVEAGSDAYPWLFGVDERAARETGIRPASWAVSVQLHNQTELRRHPTYRRQWRALLTGRRAVRLCERLLPYLRVKAHQARLAVEWPDRRRITAEPVAMMPALWQLVLAEEMAYANEGARD